MKKSALAVFLFFIFHFSFFIFFAPTPAFAQNSVPPSTNVDSNVPNSLHNWTQTVMIEVMSSLSCQLTGTDPTNATQQCLGVDQKTGKIGFVENGGGAIGTMGNMISMLYTPPAHSGDYFQNLAQNFGITKKTYAQTAGTGFDGLRPLLNLWAGFRNVVYLFFVIIFIAIGMAVMLRIKIDPRTVMTIQNQIPKIIIAILLVTFSYAIAGFLVDMMYVTTHVVGNMIGSAGQLDDRLATKASQEPNPFQAAGHIGHDTGGNSAIGLWNLIFSPSKAIGGIVGSVIQTMLGGIPLIGGLFGFLASIIVFLIVGIALLIALFRLWFVLIMAYVYILIDVVMAPFWILGGLIPGSPLNVSGWLRSLIANLAAFPATIAMFMLGKVFMNTFGTGKFTTPFVPPLIGERIDYNGIGAIIGLGVILITPNVVSMLKAMLKAPKIDTGGAFKALGAGAGAPGAIVGRAGQFGSLMFGLSRIPGINKIPFIQQAGGGGGGAPHQ